MIKIIVVLAVMHAGVCTDGMQTCPSKKHRGRPQVTAAAATSSPRNLGFYIKDEITGTLFLVETGVFCSVYPAVPHEGHIVDTDPLFLHSSQRYSSIFKWYLFSGSDVNIVQ